MARLSSTLDRNGSLVTAGAIVARCGDQFPASHLYLVIAIAEEEDTAHGTVALEPMSVARMEGVRDTTYWVDASDVLLVMSAGHRVGEARS